MNDTARPPDITSTNKDSTHDSTENEVAETNTNLDLEPSQDVVTEIESPQFLDGGYGWVIVFACCMTNFFFLGTTRSLGVVYVVWQERMGESATSTAIILSVYNTLRMLLGPLSGTLCDRFGFRKVVFIGGIIMAAGFIISGWMNQVLYLILSFSITCGIGASMLFTPPYIIVGHYFNKRKGIAMALSTIGAGLGTLVMAQVLTALFEWQTYQGAMLIVGGLVLNNCVAGCLLRQAPSHHPVPINQRIQDTKKENEVELQRTDSVDIGNEKPVVIHNRCEDEKKNMERANSDDIESTKLILEKSGSAEKMRQEDTNVSSDALSPNTIENLPTTKSLSNRIYTAVKSKLSLFSYVQFTAYLIHAMIMPVSLLSVMTFLPALAEEKGLNRSQSAWLISICGMCDIVGRIGFGFIFDIKQLRNYRRYLLASLGFALGFSCLCFAFGESFISFVMCSVLYGIVEGGYHGQRMTIITELLPHRYMSQAVGLSILFQGFGNLWGPPTLGFMKDQLGTYVYGYFFAGCLFCSTCVFFIITMLVYHRWSRKQNV